MNHNRILFRLTTQSVYLTGDPHLPGSFVSFQLPINIANNLMLLLPFSGSSFIEFSDVSAVSVQVHVTEIDVVLQVSHDNLYIAIPLVSSNSPLRRRHSYFA